MFVHVAGQPRFN